MAGAIQGGLLYVPIVCVAVFCMYVFVVWSSDNGVAI